MCRHFEIAVARVEFWVESSHLHSSLLSLNCLPEIGINHL